MKAPTSSQVQDPPERTLSSTRKPSKSILGIFSSTFITIFLAEMGDKTQLTTLLMTAESDAPWVVFLGAALALITTSLIGVLLGRWLANRVSEETIETFAAVILLFIAILLLGEMVSL
ncbi:MAG: TMEM165/GDT1 family protein [Phormidium sp. GEM2.Bin31]|nr:TMEM165/GDT1 family protein [Phormidium sp. BM_Day4_Bin.17]TVR07392.1 MAG: TMEM165/GDT1 family protein [Phormidium sp. GEM2.Bin31]UCJ13870.1 MAG: TMEM165/GDT1 family protein [Phormidium sp. PBR-2020]